MRKILVIVALLICTNSLAQVQYSPIDKKDLERVGRLLVQDRINSVLSNNYLTLGPVNLGPVERFVSYNPIEGVRLRVSGQTNTKFSKRLALNFLLAYGTTDNKLKYGLSVGVSLKKKPTSAYAFPANVLTVSYKDDSYMPNFPNYDMIYYSLSPWREYYLTYRRKASVKYLYEFPIGLGFSPFAGFESIYSNLYYSEKHIEETLSKTYNYMNAGMEISFRPQRRQKGKTSLNARLPYHPSTASVKYVHNFLYENLNNSYGVASLLLSERVFVGKRLALDFQLKGGKIFGSTTRSLYFTPSQSYGVVSNPYGMNLLDFGKYFYRKQYIQAFLQLNLGGLLADNIPFLRKSRINEFIYGKALYGDYAPYYEIGAGVDNIFSCLGVEIIRSFCNEADMGSGFWGVRLRLKQIGF